MKNAKFLLLCLALSIGAQQEVAAYSKSKSSAIKSFATLQADGHGDDCGCSGCGGETTED